MTQAELAAAIGVDAGELAAVEAGATPMDSMLMRRLAWALDVPASAFFDTDRGEIIASLHATGELPLSPMARWALDLHADMVQAAEYVNGSTAARA